MKDLLYLYCVTERQPKPKETESPGAKDFGAGVYFVCHQGLYGVVSRVEESEFGQESLKENLADLEWIKTRVSVHEKIIEEVMKESTVIPFKFATLFNTADNLKAMLDEHANDFKAKLKNLEGKEEWGIKIYCDLERSKNLLMREEGEISKIDREIESSSPGKAFFLKKKKEELLKTQVNKKMNEYGQESFKRLKQHSLQARINKLLPREVTERKDEMILNSAFLVDKSKVSGFIRTAGELKTKYSSEGINLDCTGPWPPYNFCQNVIE